MNARVLAMFVALPVAALAEPITLSQSGYVVGANDAPITASLPMVFRLFGTSSGGTAVWTSASCSIAVQAGYYATVLGGDCGGTPALDASHLPAGAPRFLELAVDGVVLQPRHALTPTPSAIDAQRLGGRPAAEFVQHAQLGATGSAAIDASRMTSGTLADARLGANVARLDATSAQVFAGAVQAPSFSGNGAQLTNVNALTIGGRTLAELEVANGSITTQKLAIGAVVGDRIPDASIATEKLAGPIPLSLTTGALDGSRVSGTLPGSVFGNMRVPVDTNRTTCPTADRGAVYMNTADDQLYICNGSVWKRASARPATLEWEPAALDFGTVQTWAAVQRTVVLKNAGDFTATSVSTSIPARYTVNSNNCGTTLAAGATCTIVLTLASTGVAETRADTATATHANGTVSLALAGSPQAALATCKALKQAQSTLTTGPYLIDPDGAGTGVAPFTAYCDMSTDTGGWTHVLHFYNHAGFSENAFITAFGHPRFTDATWTATPGTGAISASVPNLTPLTGQGGLNISLFANKWTDVRMTCNAAASTAAVTHFAQVDNYTVTNGSPLLIGGSPNGRSYTVAPSKNSFNLSTIWHDNEKSGTNSGHYMCDITNDEGAATGTSQFGFCYTNFLSCDNNCDYGDSVVSLAFGSNRGNDTWSAGFSGECGNMGQGFISDSGTWSIWIR